MSVVVRLPPERDKEPYDSVRSALEGSGARRPDGCQVHGCFGDENDIRVSEIWESQESFEAFGEKLMAEIEKAGIQLSGQPEVFETPYRRRLLRQRIGCRPEARRCTRRR